MQRARGSAADAAAAAAAAATVAPLLQLRRAAQKASKLARVARAVELDERALAAADKLALPRDALIVPALLHDLIIARYNNAAEASPSNSAAAGGLDLELRCLHLLHARWQAGTFFLPTAEETAYFVEDEYPCLPAQMCGAFFYISAAEVVVLQPPRVFAQCTPVDTEARLHAVCGALRAVLEMKAQGMLERNPRTGQAWPASSASPSVQLKLMVYRFVTDALTYNAGMLLHMRATCGLSAAEETALHQLAERYKAVSERRHQEIEKQLEDVDVSQQQTAAADAARHGLRRCALPACGAQEPHPKLFKLCGRCHATAYCCKQHQTDDWKRHKREDGCTAAP
jgi:hypothetical protein